MKLEPINEDTRRGHIVRSIRELIDSGAGRPDAHDTYVNLAHGADLDAILDHLDAHMRQGLERRLGDIDAAERNGATKDAATRRSKKRSGRLDT